MPDIKRPIIFSKNSKKTIKEFQENSSYSYKNWGEDCLREVRAEIREHYRNEQEYKCCFCRQTVSITGALDSQIDHIIAKSHFEEFLFHPKNLCISCSDCNFNKGEELLSKNKTLKRYPFSSKAFLIFHPHYDNFEDEILIENEIYFFGKTPKGRKTVEKCNLARFAVAAHESSKIIYSIPEARKLALEFYSSNDPLETAQLLHSLANLIRPKKS